MLENVCKIIPIAVMAWPPKMEIQLIVVMAWPPNMKNPVGCRNYFKVAQITSVVLTLTHLFGRNFQLLGYMRHCLTLIVKCQVDNTFNHKQ